MESWKDNTVKCGESKVRGEVDSLLGELEGSALNWEYLYPDDQLNPEAMVLAITNLYQRVHALEVHVLAREQER